MYQGRSSCSLGSCFLFSLFWNSISHSPGWFGTLSISEDVLELIHSVPTSRVLGLQECGNLHGLFVVCACVYVCYWVLVVIWVCEGACDDHKTSFGDSSQKPSTFLILPGFEGWNFTNLVWNSWAQWSSCFSLSTRTIGASHCVQILSSLGLPFIQFIVSMWASC